MAPVTPLISVYIASHNYGKFLTQAIESVLRQSFDNWELLIIDDNSVDNTQEVMNRYRGDQRIRLFTTEGIGLHGVCNLALKEASGEYIIRLDGDDIFDEQILLVLSNYLNKHPDIALVFPDYYLIDEFSDIFAHEKRQKLYSNNHAFDMPPNGACFLARTRVLRELGGYREDLAAQDGYYIWNKLIGKHKCANINLPLYYYRRHGDNLTNKSSRIFEARRQIKRETVLLHLDDFRPFTAVIPCRRNYDFVPDLWKQKINSRCMINNAVEKCIESKILDQIVVACDNPDIQEQLCEYTDPRIKFFLRDQRETIRSESVVPTLDRIISEFSLSPNGVTIVSYVQAPFVTTDTLEEAIFTLVMHNADCSVGVEEIDRRTYQRSSFGLRPLNPYSDVSSDFHKIYAETRTVLATRNYNLKTGSLTGAKVVNFLVSKDESYMIDSERSFQIAGIIGAQKRVLAL
ncbi:MAG: glycosyltransferase [Deltaproteobacteria bacterium]|nr:glycosyltransferase [Deltaproteobacteria bacterium]